MDALTKEELEEKQQELQKKEEALEAREIELKKKEENLEARDQELKDDEKKMEEKQQKLNQDYDSWADTLKEMTKYKKDKEKLVRMQKKMDEEQDYQDNKKKEWKKTEEKCQKLIDNLQCKKDQLSVTCDALEKTEGDLMTKVGNAIKEYRDIQQQKLDNFNFEQNLLKFEANLKRRESELQSNKRGKKNLELSLSLVELFIFLDSYTVIARNGGIIEITRVLQHLQDAENKRDSKLFEQFRARLENKARTLVTNEAYRAGRRNPKKTVQTGLTDDDISKLKAALGKDERLDQKDAVIEEMREKIQSLEKRIKCRSRSRSRYSRHQRSRSRHQRSRSRHQRSRSRRR
jgi:hypothetical protein